MSGLPWETLDKSDNKWYPPMPEDIKEIRRLVKQTVWSFQPNMSTSRSQKEPPNGSIKQQPQNDTNDEDEQNKRRISPMSPTTKMMTMAAPARVVVDVEGSAFNYQRKRLLILLPSLLLLPRRNDKRFERSLSL
jgi:hypothetical protein